MDKLKNIASRAKRSFKADGYRESGEDALISREETKEHLQDITLQAERLERVQERLLSRRTADEVIHEFSVDAARVLVAEMYTAKGAKDRITAAIQVLDRGLGKPVEKHMNVNAEVSGMSEVELDSNLLKTLLELGEDVKEFKSRTKGGVAPLFIEEDPKGADKI